MTTVVITIFAAIGAFSVCLFVVWPLVWCVCYATGRLIFQLRSAPGLVKRNGALGLIRACVKEWLRGFREALTCPASAMACGQMKWEPLFKYSGFKGANHE